MQARVRPSSRVFIELQGKLVEREARSRPALGASGTLDVFLWTGVVPRVTLLQGSPECECRQTSAVRRKPLRVLGALTSINMPVRRLFTVEIAAVSIAVLA